jgi:hypothetical protein
MVGTSLLLSAFAAEPSSPLEPEEATPEEIAEEMARDTRSFYSEAGPMLSTSQELLNKRLRRDFQFLKGIGLTPLQVASGAGSQASYRVEVDVFKRPKALATGLEFMTLKVDGILQDAYVISSAVSGHYTIEGEFPVSIERRSGRTNPGLKPYPWHRSSKYQNSPMFWGLHLSGGYWSHSTPHYGDLGKPASMGCVRMSFPAAMELWDTVVNRVNGSAIVRIHGSGTSKGLAAFQALNANPSWIQERVEKDLADAQAITTGDYNGVGHARQNEPLAFPGCEDVDCFEYFGKKRPVLPN